VRRPAAVILRRCLAVLSFVLCLPSPFLSVTLLKDFLRVHRGEFYHFDYPYGTQFVLWAAIATLIAGLAVYTFFRRSYYGVLPAFAIIVGLLTVHIIPDLAPSVPMLSSIVKQLGHTEKALSDWDETHGRFPGNQDELREALTQVLAEPSHFSLGDTPVVCRIELLRNAVSAPVKTTVTQPCVLIYAVRADCAEYWLTATTLEKPTSGRVIVATGIADEPFVVHRTHLKPGEGHWPHFE
jgi:hypothetical protein